MVTGPSTSMQQFREVVRSSRNIVVIAGAGLSAASGDRPSAPSRPLLTSLTNRYCRYTYFPRWRGSVEEVRGYESRHS